MAPSIPRRRVRLSTNHFARAFRRTFGRPPHRWLVDRRIDQVKSLLLKSQTSLADNNALMQLRKRRGVLEVAIDNAGEVGMYCAWELKDFPDNPEQCNSGRTCSNRAPCSFARNSAELPNFNTQAIFQTKRSYAAWAIRCRLPSRGCCARMALRAFVQHESGKSSTCAKLESMARKLPSTASPHATRVVLIVLPARSRTSHSSIV
jgi:AraC-like DNA-binding protein